MSEVVKMSGISVNCAYDQEVHVDELKPYPNNNKIHNDEQVRLIAKAIKEQGWRAPITVSTLTGYIVRGHGRLEGARLLGLEYVPVDYQDYESEALERADRIADNKISDLADWDMSSLDAELNDLKVEGLDLELTGFADIPLGVDEMIEESDTNPVTIPALELRPYEHYDYVVVLADNVQDWEWLADFCDLEKVDAKNEKSKSRIGLGRGVRASVLIRKIKEAING